MSKRWVVDVSIHVEADDSHAAKQKVYEDLWPLYGDRNMEIEGVMSSFSPARSTSRTEEVK